MTASLRRLWAVLVLGRKARVDAFHTLADLLASGLALERALLVVAAAARAQGRSGQARLFEGWRRALLGGSFAEAVAATVPPAEATVFSATGRIEADRLFASAARIAELGERQQGAVWSALATPLTLAAALVIMLWLAGAHLIPELQTLLPADRWTGAAGLLRAVALWLHGNSGLFLALLAATLVAGHLLLTRWTGPGRALADRVAPFSLYRTLAGSAFLFTALEFLDAGLDLNARTFEDLQRHAGPYSRHRIAAIQARMVRGHGLGRAMAEAGHGFPDPALVPAIAALDGTADWAARLRHFAERWAGRADTAMRARAGGLNAVLLALLALVAGAAIQALFDIMQQAGAFAAL